MFETRSPDEQSTQKSLCTLIGVTLLMAILLYPNTNSPSPLQTRGDVDSESLDNTLAQVGKQLRISGTDGTKNALKRLEGNVFENHDVNAIVKVMVNVSKLYNIKSMIDLSCWNHSPWVDRFLKKVVETKKKPFVYMCMDREGRRLLEAEYIIGRIPGVNMTFVHKELWADDLPSADVVFSWEGLGTNNVGLMIVKKALENIRQKNRHKYVMLGSSPAVQKNEVGRAINFRKTPFSYGFPKRIYKRLSVSGTPVTKEKHMYVYKTSTLVSQNKHHGS